MVGVSPQGRVKLYNLDGAVHLVVDLVGTFTSTGSAQVDSVPTGRVIPLDMPARMIDTRLSGGKLAGPGTRLHTVPAYPVSVAGDMAGVVMNVTATEATIATYLTVFPPDAPQPLASNLNVVPGQNVPNLAVARLTAADQMAVFNQLRRGALHRRRDGGRPRLTTSRSPTSRLPRVVGQPSDPGPLGHTSRAEAGAPGDRSPKCSPRRSRFRLPGSSVCQAAGPGSVPARPHCLPLALLSPMGDTESGRVTHG